MMYRFADYYDIIFIISGRGSHEHSWEAFGDLP
jgi:hypothetical protein